MQTDNLLWYDYAEADETPGFALMVLAGLFGAAIGSVRWAVGAYWLPDRLYCLVADALARR